MNLLAYILFLLFLCFVGATIYTGYFLRKAIQGHTPAGPESPGDKKLLFETVSFNAPDGMNLSGWYIPTEKPKAMIILIHGWSKDSGGKSSMLSHALYLYENNYATFLFDMRGYGGSGGDKRRLGQNEWQDTVAAYQYVARLPEAKGKRIGFLGISLGATVALLAAGRGRVGDFVIAAVPFATHFSLLSWQIKMSKLFPKFFFSWALFIASLVILGPVSLFFNAASYVSHIKSPILFISAKHDEMVNPQDAWILFEKSWKEKDFWQADSTHDVFSKKKEEWLGRVLQFLQTYEELN